jgi:hypothetical protein
VIGRSFMVHADPDDLGKVLSNNKNILCFDKYFSLEKISQNSLLFKKN